MEVLALVGPAGTGKSHRASLVALRESADAVIDDGLLIVDGKIVAGHSAKLAATGLGAVREALFSQPAHATEVREALARLAPSRVLILATSQRMIQRICVALSLPLPTRVLAIEDVATPQQIHKARRIRRMEGKHVVPVPTVQVRRTFAGYLVDPLRLFWRRGDDRGWLEKSVVRPTFSSLGKFSVADMAVSAIAARACRDVPGVGRVSRVAVDTRPDGLVVDLDVALQYGQRLVDVLLAAQSEVKSMLEYMTGLGVLEVNVVARHLVLDQ